MPGCRRGPRDGRGVVGWLSTQANHRARKSAHPCRNFQGATPMRPTERRPKRTDPLGSFGGDHLTDHLQPWKRSPSSDNGPLTQVDHRTNATISSLHRGTVPPSRPLCASRCLTRGAAPIAAWTLALNSLPSLRPIIASYQLSPRHCFVGGLARTVL